MSSSDESSEDRTATEPSDVSTGPDDEPEGRDGAVTDESADEPTGEPADEPTAETKGETVGETADGTADGTARPELETAAMEETSGASAKGDAPVKERTRAARIGRRTLFVTLGFLGFCVLAFGVAYLLTPVPSPQQKALAQGPTYYYSDGKTPIAKTGVNRDAVGIDRIPMHVRDAVIAAENRSFYEDPGVSVKGTLRAFWSTATGEQLQGGSTITQQMVRNYYADIGKERSVTRKLKEMMVSLKVGREKSKDWILEQYLNTIYFGRNAYGVQAAAQAYYGKDVGQLTAAEGAYLAAAIQQPSNFAYPKGAERPHAEQRWRSVLDNMVRDGAVTQAQVAKMKFPMPIKEKTTNIFKGQKGYMVHVAKKELIDRRGYSEDEINRSGLKITTTFDKRLMDAAEKAVTANVPDGTDDEIRTGMVSVDPKTGQVLAFYGGRDYLKRQLSSSFGDWAQAGSGFKPIVLATALDDGVKLYDTFNGASPQYYGGQPVPNNGGVSYGYVNMVSATQKSINTAYVNIGQKVGLDKVTEMAVKLGYPKDQLTANGANTAATFPLGVISAHPVQQAGVYATFAAEGVHRSPYVVKSVTDGQDHRRTFTEKGERAFSEQVARDATYAMSKVVEAGTATGAQLYDGRDVAGKTGTTDEGRAIWFNGFVPQMATTVAMFRSDGKPLDIPGYGSYGGVLPAQIWRTYMTDAVDIMDYPAEEFGSPSVATGGYQERPTYSSRPDTEPTMRPERPTDPPTTGDPGGEPTDPPPTGDPGDGDPGDGEPTLPPDPGTGGPGGPGGGRRPELDG